MQNYVYKNNVDYPMYPEVNNSDYKFLWSPYATLNDTKRYLTDDPRGLMRKRQLEQVLIWC